MKTKVAALSLLCILLCTSFKTEPAKVHPANKQILLMGSAIVELFTSEGCASCPPADEALLRLSREFSAKPVYFLSFHVDYWDKGGWRDQFSDPAFTARQRVYNQLLHTEAYTPQAVINGKQEMIGSEIASMRNSITKLLTVWPTNSVSFSVSYLGSKLLLRYHLHSADDNDLVNIALVQERVTDHVTAGENKGFFITHVNAVRVFKTVKAQQDGSAELTIPADLYKRPFRLILYTQTRSDWHITSGNSVVVNPGK